MFSKKSQKGVILFLTMMILSVILAIVLGLSTILVGQMKTIRGLGDSIIAFYAADTGIEQVLVDAVNPATPPPQSRYPSPAGTTIELDNGAKYYVEVYLSTDPSCDEDNYCVRSVGTYGNAKRAVEAGW